MDETETVEGIAYVYAKVEWLMTSRGRVKELMKHYKEENNQLVRDEIIKVLYHVTTKLAIGRKKNLPHRVELADLRQEALLSMIKAVDSFNSKTSDNPIGWITTNVKWDLGDYCRDYRRQHKDISVADREKVENRYYVERLWDKSVESQVITAIKNEQLKRLREGISLLNKEEYCVILKIIGEGLSFAKLARQWATHEWTVAKQFYRAFWKLKAACLFRS